MIMISAFLYGTFQLFFVEAKKHNILFIIKYYACSGRAYLIFFLYISTAQ